MSYATKEQLAELAAYMASQINVPTIGIGGGYAPIGTIISYMGTTAPQDYLACDGSVKNITDYPQLADFFESQFGSKNYFGGDGVTTFGLPDLQGEFLRGTGTNSHTDQGDGGTVGTHQDATTVMNIYTRDSKFFAFHDNSSGNYGSVNYDKVLKRSINNISFTSSKGNDDQDLIGTVRPTNTSILYCIKAVVAGDVYSTDERVVGTWIDGKKLYQRTLVKTGGVSNRTVYFNNELADAEFTQKVACVFYATTDNAYKNEWYAGANDFASCIVWTKCAYPIFSGATITEMYLTVQYTKTTD